MPPVFPTFMSDTHLIERDSIAVVVPAAGVGKRMQSAVPKQYLLLDGKAVLEHTVERLLSHPLVGTVVVALSPDDDYFSDLAIADNKQVVRVQGGKERSDSVLAGLNYLLASNLNKTEKGHSGNISSVNESWVLVHDAARPCITHQDITKLTTQCLNLKCGGILAKPVSDTMKQVKAIDIQEAQATHSSKVINQTIDRERLWHALTPQMFPLQGLQQALTVAMEQARVITDESSAMELNTYSPIIVEGRADNIKITQPDDLDLASFYLHKQLVTGIK